MWRPGLFCFFVYGWLSSMETSSYVRKHRMTIIMVYVVILLYHLHSDIQ